MVEQHRCIMSGRRAAVRLLAPPEESQGTAAPESFDYYEIPAAVLCAACGRADCDGCFAADEDASGVIAIVPWERTDSDETGWQRLWSTANATTQGAETFFGALPKGQLGAAFRFALIAEGLAVASMLSALLAVLIGVLGFVFPALLKTVLLDPSLRNEVLRWLALGVPLLTFWMVFIHAVHGLAVDAAARRQGGSKRRNHALRFGLYACGWDLMVSPIGAVVVLFNDGMLSMLALAKLGMTVPGVAANALLRGIYALDAAAADRARFRAVVIATMLVVVSLLAVVVGLFVAHA
jgi:hypothetical protein